MAPVRDLEASQLNQVVNPICVRVRDGHTQVRLKEVGHVWGRAGELQVGGVGGGAMQGEERGGGGWAD